MSTPPHPSTQAAAKVQPLTKAHHLLRGTAPFTLRSLLAAPRRGDVVADWGAANLRLLVLNPAGAALGTVDFAARAFCGGVGEIVVARLVSNTQLP